MSNKDNEEKYTQDNGREYKAAQGKSTIKLNKKMRLWNKYKNVCFICAGVAVAAVVGVVAYQGFSGRGKESTSSTSTAAASNTSQTTAAVQTTAAQATTAAQQTTAAQATTAAIPAFSALSIAAPAQAQEFTTRDYFNGSIFIGDSIVNGITYYNYLDASQVLSDGNNTTDKAAEYIGGVVNSNPSKVFIMVGLNDINYGTRDAQTIADNIMSIATQIKTSLPTANVCVMSLLPVTQEFEAKPTTNVTQAAIDQVNGILQTASPAGSVTYLDVATAFKDQTGYMNPAFTGNGSNIYNEYYPYLLNGIAGVVK